jgi:acyl-CoA thioester hydrolase
MSVPPQPSESSGRQTPELQFLDTTVRVRYAETDQMGVVYYGNYLTWFEVGRVAWCRARGFSYSEMESQDKRFLVVAEVSCRYQAPARFDEEILIRTAVASATERVIRFQYEIRNQRTAQLLATGESAHVVTDDAFRPSRLPKQFHRCFSIAERHRSSHAAAVRPKNKNALQPE